MVIELMFLDLEIGVGDNTEHDFVLMQFNTKLDPYEVYAEKVDNVDILSFYTKYHENNEY